MTKNFSEQKYTFGGVVVEPKKNTLVINGRTKRVAPKLILLLNYFVKHANRVITREELMAEVWPGVIVGEEVVTRAIFTLRNALGDDVKSPKYIETISKKGYQFLTPAETLQSDEDKKSNYLFQIATFVSAVFIILLFNLDLFQKNFEIDKILPLENSIGLESEISANALESHLAYVQVNESNYQLIVKNINNNEIIVLANDDWVKTSPRWLDNDTIIFNRCLNGDCQLVRTNLTKQEEILYKTTNHISLLTIVTAEENLVVFDEGVEGNLPRLSSLNLLNGSITSLKARLSSIPESALNPVYSPENNLLFTIGIAALNPVIYAFDFSTGKQVFTMESFDDVQAISIGLTKNQLIVTGTKSGTHGIWLVNIINQQTELVVRRTGAEYIQEAIALPKKNKIIYSTKSIKKDIIQLSPSGKENRLIALNSSANDGTARYASSGEEIYFVSDRSGLHELWVYNEKTKQSQQITQINAMLIMSPVPSHNNKFIAMVFKDTKLKLAIISRESGAVVSSKEITDIQFPISWSNDDTHIYVNDYLNNLSLFKYDITSFNKSLMREDTGLFAQEEKDGSLITFDLTEKTFIKIHPIQKSEKQLTEKIPTLTARLPGKITYSNEVFTVAFRVNNGIEITEYPILGSNTKVNESIKHDSKFDITYAMHPENKDILVSSKAEMSSVIMTINLK